MSKFKDWYRNLSNRTKAVINTTWQSFVGVFSVAVLGFLGDVQQWAGCDNDCHFPSVSPIGKALGAAVVAAVTGLVTFIFRSVKPAPQYATTQVEVVQPADGGV